LVLAGTASAAPLLTIDDALHTALAQKPQLRQQQALTAAAMARADEARAPILPQLTGLAQYQRATGNFAPRPGAIPNTCAMPPCNTTVVSTFTSYNYFNFNLVLSQFIWDFGVTTDKWKAAVVAIDAQKDTERYTRQQVVLTVIAAYLQAAANTALVGVARENLSNQDRHLKQVEAFVQQGLRPLIDLAQAKSDRATAELQLINTENSLGLSKAQLDQAMGRERSDDYEVEQGPLPPVDVEDHSIEDLVGDALRDRPDLKSILASIRAQELTLRSVKGGYGPSIYASATLSDAGTDITQMGWNISGGLTVSWNLFSGLATYSSVKEQHANLLALQAQRDTIRQQVRVDVAQARLSIRAGKAAIRSAEDALINARERFRLAEGRYEKGIGNAVEMGDAQVAVTTAAAQKVQAELNLSLARAQLRQALGRD
jgi:outer membrane protein